MASSVFWTRIAEQDRDEIIEYLLFEASNGKAAANFMDGLDHAIELLEANPRMSALCDEPRLHTLGYRKHPIGKYVLLYRTESDRVILARVFHMSQNYARLL